MNEQMTAREELADALMIMYETGFKDGQYWLCSKGGPVMTLRERLAARRQRIAAGLPPPDPVTVTERFFDGIERLTERECVNPDCRKVFMPKMTTQVTCGDRECRRVNGLATGKKWRQRMQSQWKPERMVCAAPGCEREFLPQGPQQVTCGNPWCQREHHLRKQREYNQRYYEKRKKEAAA